MGTRYEIAAKHPDGRAFLVGYIARRSHRGLTAFLITTRNQDAIKHATGLDGETDFNFYTEPRPHWRCGDGWTFGFTGRTQFQARNEGELPSAVAFAKARPQ